ncbi:MarR family transcriptional regulator [Actinoplanes sp. NPDC026619]|uniref:MarR family winged helix-turn-helix transcriptional regulator n=1 Tax=Actinoplanes sp. NPDC026619 TaxID=3155798 RepID=UPI0033EEB5A6
MDEESLSEEFWTVARRLRHRTRSALEQWDLNPSLARALSVLSRHPGVRLSTLADHLRIAPRSATEVADSLTELGLALREPDPADRRATLLSLTPRGIATSDAIRAARQASGEEFFEKLTADDRSALSAILRKLRED